MSGEKNRHFGNIRKLASGRYQARYRGQTAGSMQLRTPSSGSRRLPGG